jgi:predicted dehydrogenase
MTLFTSTPPSLEYRPAFPKHRGELGIGIVGFGGVAKKWHLTAYKKYGLKVVGVYDISPQATAEIKPHPEKLQVFERLEQLLEHPEIQIVDIATRPVGRIELVRKALRAGKHVLAQKPFATNLDEAYSVVEEAERRRLKLAVNQNGRWAPPWRYASLLIQDGAIGEVQSVTHLYDTRLSWMPNPLHGSANFFIYDYSIHWIDITRCWLEDKNLVTVRAQTFPSLQRPEDGSVMQSMWLMMEYTDGTNAVIRGVGCAHSHTGHPFWIHGTEGTIRGSVDCKSGDYVELEKQGRRSRYELEGDWFPDGFAGAMGELFCAITEDREPYNSARHHLLSLETTLAACQSAERSGMPVRIHAQPNHVT